VPPDFGKLLITSNCDTSETSIIPAMPRFVTNDDGSVELDVTFDGVSDEESSAMSFLESSAYKAFWSWSGGFDQFFPGPQTIQPTEIINTSGGKCETGAAADPNNSCQGEGEYCYLKEGVCNDKSGIHSGYCQVKPDLCAEIYDPVCGCDGNDYSNACAASSAGVSISRSGTCEDSTTEPLPVTSEVKCEVGFAADPDNNCKGEGEYCHLEEGVCTEKSGIHNGYCLVKPPFCAEIYQPVCGCDGEDYGNACAANSVGVSVSHSGTCADKTTIEVIEKLPPFVEDCPEGECINPESNTCETKVQCVADPCEVGGACAEGEVCSANYCGGCNVVCTASLPATLNGDDPVSSNIEEVCGVGEACSEVGASCTAGEETCCGVTHPSLQCDCMDIPNGGLEYMCRSTDMCLYPSCCQEPPPESMPPASEGTCDNMGQLCDTGIDDDYCCLDLSGGRASYCTKSGGKSGGTTTSEATTSSTFTTTTTTTSTEMIEETSTESTTTENLIEETSSPSSSSTPIKVETTTDATVSEIISTTSTFAAIDGDFPTKSPTSNVEESGAPTPSPNWWDGAQDSDTDRSSGFNRAFRMTTAIFAIVIITIILPNNENNHLWFGKFALFAMAISSLYPKRSSSKVGGIRKNEQQRHLQETCTFNVEILINSCSKTVTINNAPAARAIDVVVENNTQEILENNVVNYEAILTFPATEATVVLNLEENNTVNAFDEWEGSCLKAVIGRPYVDSTGATLHAMPLIGGNEVKLSWSSEALVSTAPQNNGTSHGRFLLGEEWTNRALGEHSSVASFSAFSIALMSNQAPSELVEDALKAGLDEIKHTKQSFDIVSRLTDKIIGPGPLPQSTHEFNHDIKKLALAVAKEGCVDETLSAFSAALEVDHITAVMDQGVQDSLYSDIDHETLTFIKEQLVIIAMDESNHAALAWRTLQWICSIDTDACDVAQNEVFEESKLEMRFQYRAEGSFGETSNVLDSMREMWMKIYAAHQSAQDTSSCEEVDTINDTEDYSLLTTVTDNVIHQLA